MSQNIPSISNTVPSQTGTLVLSHSGAILQATGDFESDTTTPATILALINDARRVCISSSNSNTTNSTTTNHSISSSSHARPASNSKAHSNSFSGSSVPPPSPIHHPSSQSSHKSDLMGRRAQGGATVKADEDSETRRDEGVVQRITVAIGSTALVITIDKEGIFVVKKPV